VHVPFCAGACDYCDFYSVPVKPDDPIMSLYVNAVLEESRLLLEKYNIDKIPTVFIGGGTPSVLGTELLYRLLTGLQRIIKTYSAENPAEITMEANPESCSIELLTAAKEAGVNRLSLGIQSFCAQSRQAIGRIGECSLLPQKLRIASDLFPDNFSVDLISGLPYQNEKILLDDIKKILSFRPAHVSLYSLTVEHGTVLAEKISRGQIRLPPKDEADRLWIAGRDFLENSGYGQYEVSNFCIYGRESLHNLRYWRMENWLGAGPAASGTLIDDTNGTGLRFTNDADIEKWLSCTTGKIPAGNAENLDTLTLMEETMMMGFRLTGGPDRKLFKRRFKKDIEEYIPKTINSWLKKGLFSTEKTALAKDGLLLLDQFLVEAFLETEACFNVI